MDWDQQTIWHNVVDVKHHDPMQSELREIDKSGTVLNQISVPGAHHSFDLYPMATLSPSSQSCGYRKPWTGCGRSHRKNIKWRNRNAALKFDVLEAAPMTEMWNHGQFSDAKDWTHANCIRYDQSSHTLLLTVLA